VRLRPLLPALAVALCALVGTASSAPPGEAVRGVRGLEIALKGTEARLQTLLALAEQSKEALLVRWYRNLTPEKLKDPKRDVGVAELWKEVVLEPGVPEETKNAAAEAIINPSTVDEDPDLVRDGARGAKRKRAEFSLKVTPGLTEKAPEDRIVRVLASKVLGALWPNMTDPDVLRYDPDNPRTWQRAKMRWEQFLKR
jgi:hypothetical protein